MTGFLVLYVDAADKKTILICDRLDLNISNLTYGLRFAY